MCTWEHVESIDYRRISVVHLVKSELSPSPSEKREGVWNRRGGEGRAVSRCAISCLHLILVTFQVE